MKNLESIYYACSEISGIHFKVFTSHKGIRAIFLNKNNGTIDTNNLIHLQPDDPFLFGVFDELKEYFNEKRKDFSVPLELNGSEFQLKVWDELQKIPYGKTASYKTIAERLGDEKLLRAVGKANGTNPVPIIVPCHRVINSDGSLGGYSAGLKIKEKLLKLEGSMDLTLFE